MIETSLPSHGLMRDIYERELPRFQQWWDTNPGFVAPGPHLPHKREHYWHCWVSAILEGHNPMAIYVGSLLEM